MLPKYDKIHAYEGKIQTYPFPILFFCCLTPRLGITLVFKQPRFVSSDPRFPTDGAVELHFSSGSEGRAPAPAPTPAVPITLSDDPVTRADSPFDFEDSDDENIDQGEYSTAFFTRSVFTTYLTTNQFVVCLREFGFETKVKTAVGLCAGANL